ncbi:hypothetical protein IFU37_014915 [Pantoea agglomerans]|uniref:hypothetical protein n=1 Tax=Enterobacter agglomerans TaxID=549 RepID=UPI0017824565|nr:hypothetical protein [Pantoea agglomerans]WVL88898.1 hypothetical protein IFU37_014915 [Pantoea agglomerans]
MKNNIPEDFTVGEFIFAPGLSDDGLPDISVHADHGGTFIGTLLVNDIPQWVSDMWDPCVLLETELMQYWVKQGNTSDNGNMLMFWRWAVAHAFDEEQRQANGTVTCEWRPGEYVQCAIYRGQHGAMNLYPAAERMAMANNIEGALIERFGREEGTRNAIEFYVAMRDAGGGLTPMGREVMSRMHDMFIREVNECGLPDEPVTH